MRYAIKISVLILLLFIVVLSGCVNVKPFQKAYLNDEEMKLENRPSQGFETDTETYREGAAGANGGKSGGGCGCN